MYYISAGSRNCDGKMLKKLYGGVFFRSQMLNHAYHDRIESESIENATKLYQFRV